MEKEKHEQTGNPEPETEKGLTEAPLDQGGDIIQKYVALQVRFNAAKEHLDGLQDFFEKVQAWTADQADFEASELKKFMVLSTYRVIRESQVKIRFELREIQSKALPMFVETLAPSREDL